MNRTHADARPGSGQAATSTVGLQFPRAGDAGAGKSRASRS
jgi:hypothetical protein